MRWVREAQLVSMPKEEDVREKPKTRIGVFGGWMEIPKEVRREGTGEDERGRMEDLR